MKRTYCDVCGKEITRNAVTDSPDTWVSGVWNCGDLCLHCLIDAVNTLDDRPKEPERPANILHYGDNNTIHGSRVVNVESDEEGRVVAVWFRCMPLPFTHNVCGDQRANEMRRMYSTSPALAITAIDFLKDEEPGEEDR